jgi:hypothetical protein
MARLSIIRERGPATVAADVFPLDTLNVCGGGGFRFGVRDDDADELKTILGEHHGFYIGDATGVFWFWARLQSLEPCVSTHPGLALSRDKPTLRGVLCIVEEGATRLQ